MIFARDSDVILTKAAGEGRLDRPGPREITRGPWRYPQYIQHSKGEFTVAKRGYVINRSRWFSERSAAYLGKRTSCCHADDRIFGLAADGFALEYRIRAQS